MSEKIVDVKIHPGEPDKKDEKKAKAGEYVTPKYITNIELTPEQQTRIVEEICNELDVIEQERKELGIIDHWDALDAQYEGEMEEMEDMEFGLHKHSTKNKVDSVERAVKKSFFDIDPMFSITPRPGYEKQGGKEVTDRQTEFLDQRLDEVIPLEQMFPKTAHNAVLKGVGVLSFFPLIDVQDRQREECYEGKLVPLRDKKNQVIRDANGAPRMINQGLKEFLSNYPEAATDPQYAGYIKRLQNNEKIHIVVQYKTIEYNDPWPQNVNPKMFWVRKGVDGYRGLCNAHSYAEQKEFTWWDLRKERDKFNFYNLDKLIHDKKESDSKTESADKNANPYEEKPRAGYEKETFEIFLCVHTTKVPVKGIDGQDTEEERKGIFWIDRERKVMVGSINYPFYGFSSFYLPFNVSDKHEGWYKPGIGKYLTDSNIAQNAFLNFTLQGFWQANTITPITKDPKVQSQFLEKEWAHGVPLETNPGDIRFLNEYMKPYDVGRALSLIQYLVQGDEDATGIPSVLTGRESPVDPTAPAAKHLAQIEQGNANVSEFVKAMLPSFNMIPVIILQMYYQMANEALKYKVKTDAVTGTDIFEQITRDQLVARTNIQSRAIQYSHDKLREKKEDLALYQVVRQEAMVAKNPKAVYELLKNLIVGWSPKWKNNVDLILPPFEEFQKEMQVTAVKAVALYVQSVLAESKVTGNPPAFDVRQLIAAVQQGVGDQVTPPTPEEAKARQEAAIEEA